MFFAPLPKRLIPYVVYAQLAKLVEESEEPGVIPEGWEEVHPSTELQRLNYNTYHSIFGYQARVFIQREHQHLVIVHGGLSHLGKLFQSTKNDEETPDATQDNAQQIPQPNNTPPPTELNAMNTFAILNHLIAVHTSEEDGLVLAAVAYTIGWLSDNRYQHYDKAVTGFGFGGYLAEASYYWARSQDLQGHYKMVVFDNPSARGLFDKWDQKEKPLGETKLREFLERDCRRFIIQPNLINAIGPQQVVFSYLQESKQQSNDASVPGQVARAAAAAMVEVCFSTDSGGRTIFNAAQYVTETVQSHQISQFETLLLREKPASWYSPVELRSIIWKKFDDASSNAYASWIVQFLLDLCRTYATATHSLPGLFIFFSIRFLHHLPNDLMESALNQVKKATDTIKKIEWFSAAITYIEESLKGIKKYLQQVFKACIENIAELEALRMTVKFGSDTLHSMHYLLKHSWNKKEIEELFKQVDGVFNVQRNTFRDHVMSLTGLLSSTEPSERRLYSPGELLRDQVVSCIPSVVANQIVEHNGDFRLASVRVAKKKDSVVETKKQLFIRGTAQIPPITGLTDQEWTAFNLAIRDNTVQNIQTRCIAYFKENYQEMYEQLQESTASIERNVTDLFSVNKWHKCITPVSIYAAEVAMQYKTSAEKVKIFIRKCILNTLSDIHDFFAIQTTTQYLSQLGPDWLQLFQSGFEPEKEGETSQFRQVYNNEDIRGVMEPYFEHLIIQNPLSLSVRLQTVAGPADALNTLIQIGERYPENTRTTTVKRWDKIAQNYLAHPDYHAASDRFHWIWQYLARSNPLAYFERIKYYAEILRTVPRDQLEIFTNLVLRHAYWTKNHLLWSQWEERADQELLSHITKDPQVQAFKGEAMNQLTYRVYTLDQSGQLNVSGHSHKTLKQVTSDHPIAIRRINRPVQAGGVTGADASWNCLDKKYQAIWNFLNQKYQAIFKWVKEQATLEAHHFLNYCKIQGHKISTPAERESSLEQFAALTRMDIQAEFENIGHDVSWWSEADREHSFLFQLTLYLATQNIIYVDSSQSSIYSHLYSTSLNFAVNLLAKLDLINNQLVFSHDETQKRVFSMKDCSDLFKELVLKKATDLWYEAGQTINALTFADSMKKLTAMDEEFYIKPIDDKKVPETVAEKYFYLAKNKEESLPTSWGEAEKYMTEAQAHGLFLTTAQEARVQHLLWEKFTTARGKFLGLNSETFEWLEFYRNENSKDFFQAFQAYRTYRLQFFSLLTAKDEDAAAVTRLLYTKGILQEQPIKNLHLATVDASPQALEMPVHENYTIALAEKLPTDAGIEATNLRLDAAYWVLEQPDGRQYKMALDKTLGGQGFRDIIAKVSPMAYSRQIFASAISQSWQRRLTWKNETQHTALKKQSNIQHDTNATAPQKSLFSVFIKLNEKKQAELKQQTEKEHKTYADVWNAFFKAVENTQQDPAYNNAEQNTFAHMKIVFQELDKFKQQVERDIRRIEQASTGYSGYADIQNPQYPLKQLERLYQTSMSETWIGLDEVKNSLATEAATSTEWAISAQRAIGFLKQIDNFEWVRNKIQHLTDGKELNTQLALVIKKLKAADTDKQLVAALVEKDATHMELWINALASRLRQIVFLKEWYQNSGTLPQSTGTLETIREKHDSIQKLYSKVAEITSPNGFKAFQETLQSVVNTYTSLEVTLDLLGKQDKRVNEIVLLQTLLAGQTENLHQEAWKDWLANASGYIAVFQKTIPEALARQESLLAYYKKCLTIVLKNPSILKQLEQASEQAIFTQLRQALFDTTTVLNSWFEGVNCTGQTLEAETLNNHISVGSEENVQYLELLVYLGQENSNIFEANFQSKSQQLDTTTQKLDTMTQKVQARDARSELKDTQIDIMEELSDVERRGYRKQFGAILKPIFDAQPTHWVLLQAPAELEAWNDVWKACGRLHALWWGLRQQLLRYPQLLCQALLTTETLNGLSDSLATSQLGDKDQQTLKQAILPTDMTQTALAWAYSRWQTVDHRLQAFLSAPSPASTPAPAEVSAASSASQALESLSHTLAHLPWTLWADSLAEWLYQLSKYIREELATTAALPANTAPRQLTP